SELCSPNDALKSACGDAPPAGTLATGLAGYSCPRGARPDMDPHYNEGVPEGLVCADNGAAHSDDSQDYCCSPPDTTCAFNPAATCPGAVYTMLLTGGQEATPNDSPATGNVMVSFNYTASSIAVAGSFSNLTAAPTSADISGPAAFGQTAPDPASGGF